MINKVDSNCIHCHCFEIDGSYIVYDYYYDVIMRVSKEVYECINKVLNNEMVFNESKEYLFVEELIEEGLFVGDFNLPKENFNTAYLHFAPVYGCNFRCTYCFGKYGENFHGKDKVFDDKLMEKVVHKFVNEWFSDFKYYRIDFVSGGEPLLNFELVKKTVLYAEKLNEKYGKKISVWLCTNGSLLTEEICEFLNEHNISIGISIDGEKRNHDICRKDKYGEGTYEIVVKNIKKILESDKYTKKFKNLWGLSVVSKENENVNQIVKHNLNLGIKNIQMNIFRGKSFGMNAENIVAQFRYLCIKIFEEYKVNKFDTLFSICNDNDYFGKLLKRIFLHEIAMRRCGAGSVNVTVCPDGSVYPCDSFVGIKEYCLGDYESMDTVCNDFKNICVDNSEICKKCSVRYICGGDCYYNAYINSGKVDVPDNVYCNIQKGIINQSIELKLKMQEYDNNVNVNVEML